MTKIVINKCYGGYGLNKKAVLRLRELGCQEAIEYDDCMLNDTTLFDSHYICEDDRSNPLLIQIVEEMGEEVNTQCSELKVVEIPDDVEWTIEEYDGIEWIAEKHQTWS